MSRSSFFKKKHFINEQQPCITQTEAKETDNYQVDAYVMMYVLIEHKNIADTAIKINTCCILL